jgi:hypothetical protein
VFHLDAAGKKPQFAAADEVVVEMGAGDVHD